MGDDVEVSDRVPDGTRVAARRRRDAGVRADPRACSPPSAPRSTSPATSPASPPPPPRWVDALAGTRARVLDTRKTLPTLPRAAEVRRALRRRRQPPVQPRPTWRWSRTTTCSPPAAWCRPTRPSARRYPDLPVEVEVTDLDQLRELLDAGCDRILLDNMDTDDDGRGGPDHRRPGHAGGVRRAHPRARPRGRRDRRRLHLGRARSPTRSRSSTSAWTCEERVTLLAADIGNSHTVLGLLARRRRARPLAGGHRRAPHRRRVGGAAPRPARGLDRGRRPGRDRGVRHGAGGAARVARHAARATSATCPTSSSSPACAPACRC